MIDLAMAALVQHVRIQIRDCGQPQAFPDVIDYTLATPAVVPNNSPALVQFVTDALAEFSRYRPLRKPFTLQIVAGTSLYDLPQDWIAPDMPALDAATRPQNIPDSLEFQVPTLQLSAPITSLQGSMRFEWYNDLRQVALTVAPVSSHDLRFAYYALQSPATLPAQWRDAALALACERALRAIATDQSVKLQQYKIANVMEVDNRKVAEHLISLAEGWHELFRREVIMRPYGSMGGGDSVVSWG